MKDNGIGICAVGRAPGDCGSRRLRVAGAGCSLRQEADSFQPEDKHKILLLKKATGAYSATR